MNEENKAALKHRGLLVALGGIAVVLVNMGYFPIWNFNPENTVKIDSYGALMQFFMIFAVHGALGNMLPVLLPKCRAIGALGISAGLSLLGMGIRYLIEWGEISNEINFTLQNVALQLGVTAALTLVFYIFAAKKKKLREAGHGDS